MTEIPKRKKNYVAKSCANAKKETLSKKPNPIDKSIALSATTGFIAFLNSLRISSYFISSGASSHIFGLKNLILSLPLKTACTGWI